MNKSQLREVVHNIVSRKLKEAKGVETSKYGYIIADKNTDDPRLQMIGYGNKPKSFWINKIQEDVQNLLNYVKYEDWRAAAHIIEKNGVLYSEINMMKEIFEKDIKEADENPMTDILSKNSTDTDQPEVDPRKQKDIDSVQKNIDRITADIRKLDGLKSKLEEPVRRKLQDIERRKAALQKKQGNETKKLEDLKNK
jgi:hypothetical protein